MANGLPMPWKGFSLYHMIVRSCDLAIALFLMSEAGHMSVRPSISELEAILQREDEVEIEILPNGEVRAKNQTTTTERGGRKPLTMREDLGGEYAWG